MILRRQTWHVPERLRLFEQWAKDYDDSLSNSADFPFAGYEAVLARVIQLAAPKPGMRVLDLGTGTGNLAQRFVEKGAAVWGLDFSKEMLAQARRKVPNATLLEADLLNAWPPLPKFERVVSAYVLHEFNLQAKLELLKQSAQYLREGGSIIIADIAFPNQEIFRQAHGRWREVWDESEHYWLADETLGACEEVGLKGSYTQVSSCAGVFVFQSA